MLFYNLILFILLCICNLALGSSTTDTYATSSPANPSEKTSAMPDQPLYRITTKNLWERSRGTLELSDIDSEFIHLAEGDDVDRIVKTYFSDEPYVVVLKIDPAVLTGQLVKEANPGGTKRYYHLYNGSIPMTAIIGMEERYLDCSQ